MADEVLPEDRRRMAILIKIERLDAGGAVSARAMRAVSEALRAEFGDDFEGMLSYTPDPAHAFISRLPFSDLEGRMMGWTREPTEEEEMGLVKHGEGNVLPENEQQKQGSKNGLSKEAVDEIVAEGREDDGSDD